MPRSSVAVAPVQLNLGDSAPPAKPSITMGDVLTAVRQNIVRILLAGLSGAILAVLVALVIPRYYEASTRIYIDPRGMQVMDKDVTQRGGSGEQGTLLVESEMRFLSSDNVLRQVVEKSRLAEDVEFNGQLPSLSNSIADVRSTLKSIMGLHEDPVPADLKALRYFQRAIKVRREPQSYVVDLGVTTRDAHKSQELANLIAQEYVRARFSSQASATQRASDSMSGRLDELRQIVVAAEDAVERFKRDNNIVGASGRLVNEQQLGELNSQLVIARNEATKASDLQDQVARIRRSGLEIDSLPEALRSETLSRLRTQFAAIRRREASLSASVLPSHPQMRQVAQELSDTRRLISEELNRIAEHARLDAERARANERSLERSFEDLKQLATSTNERVVKLRQLEREAEAHRSVYQSFLTRARELTQQKDIDTALATVLSPAIPPRGPKAPTLMHLLALGTLAGLGLGFHNAIGRVQRDPRLRGEEQLRSFIGSHKLTIVPDLSNAVRSFQSAPASASFGVVGSPIPLFVASHPEIAASDAIKRLSSELGARFVDDLPPVLLVTAASDYEGKSTVAVNAALAAAAAGNAVLLIDADQRGRNVSRMLDHGETLTGFLDVVSGRARAEDAIVKTAPYPVDILPLGNTAELRVARLGSLIAKIAAPYDMVVIDGGVMIRDRLVTELAFGATSIVLVAREGVTVKADFQSAMDVLNRGGKVRPVLLRDA